MANDSEPIRDLLEALQQSPDNIVLRAHVGGVLLNRGQLQEAEQLYREGLKLAPASEKLLLGLGKTLSQQGKVSAAIVLIEDLLSRPDVSAQAHLLHARLLLKSGDPQRGSVAYQRAVNADPSLADEDLAEALGVVEAEAEFDDDFAEVDSEGRIRMRAEAPGAAMVSIEMEKPDMSFADVGGMDGLKDEVRIKLIEPMRNPEIYKAYGKSIGGGLLMYGPPGCGKTYLARATAGEVDAGFIAVGIHDVLDMYLGNSESKLHALFEYARSNTPCVLFFDEVDALGAKRSDLQGSAGRQVINQFLSELDGVKSSNDGVLVLAATNAPWHLDSAFRRPGRFDRVLFVPPPDQPARAEVLRALLKGKPQQDIDVDAVARKTPGLSGADLKAVIDRAVEAKLREAVKTGVPGPLTTKDLVKSAKTTKPTTKEWFATAKNYALYSNQGGEYDDVLDYLKLK